MILIGWSVLYVALTSLNIYLSSNPNFYNISGFEKTVIQDTDLNFQHYVLKGLGFFSILLSTIPLSFSNIIDLLVVMSTNFAEWDVNVTPAKINFIYPHATLAFGKVAHMFFSRVAIQRDDKQCVKIFHIGGHFFKNQITKQLYDKMRLENTENSFDKDDSSDSKSDSNIEELTLDYLPNELKYTTKF